MNFEVIDNLFQIVMLGGASLASLGLSVRCQERRFLILSFGYACFCMGTLFYVLHLAITGDMPQVSYISELSWVASYLFFLSLQIVRIEGQKFGFSLFPTLMIGALTCQSLLHRLMISVFLSFLFAVAVDILFYTSLYRIQKKAAHRQLDVCFSGCIVLQMCVYFASIFPLDFTRFNIYFALDMMLTAALVMLLPLLYLEVKRL